MGLVKSHICDAIKQNESELINPKIKPNKSDIFFLFFNVFAITQNAISQNQLPNLHGVFTKLKLKGTVRDKKNFQITLNVKKNTFQSQYVPFFLKKLHNFDREMAFHKISFRGQ